MMFENAPDHSNGFKEPWLIQRLDPPRAGQDGTLLPDNPFSFGGGLLNGGLTEEAMILLRPLFTFDYMGSAEFEFGIVPLTLGFIVDNRKKYKTQVLDAITKAKHTAKIYLIIPKKFEEEILAFVINEAFDPASAMGGRRGGLKEATRLSRTIDANNPVVLNSHPDSVTTYHRAGGWLELDNGFMFFTDKTMFEGIAKLFEIKIPNEILV